MTCFHCWCGFDGRYCDECAPDAVLRPKVMLARRIAALKIGKEFLAACNSAWACGEPAHRVKTMLDLADKFEAALTDCFAYELEPALGDGSPPEEQQSVSVAQAHQPLPIGDAETVQVDDRNPEQGNSELVVEGHTSSCLACVRRSERNMPPCENHQELRAAISTAITEADGAFGYSYRMTGLVNDVETHTLFMDGFEPVSFENRDDGDRLIAERRNRLRADAILAALSPQTLPAPGEVEYAEAARVIFNACRDRFMHAAQCCPAVDALAAAGFITPSNAPNFSSSPILASVSAAEARHGHR